METKVFMKMKNILSIALLAFIVSSCNHPSEMMSIDVDKAMNTDVSKNLSDVVSKLDYVALETDSNCLVSNRFEVALFENEIAVISKRQILLFDRATGKFKHEVLHWGNDPGGFLGTIVGQGLTANEKTGDIFINEWSKHVSAYNIYSEERMKIPVKTIKSFAYTDDDAFVATAFNFTGTQEVKMWIYRHDQCIDSIPNHWTFEPANDAIAVINNDEIFYRMNNRTYFKDATNDTVFAVTDTLTPAYRFYPSSRLPQIDLRTHQDMLAIKMKDLYCVDNIAEDAGNIYYTVKYKDETYHLLYDKKSQEGGVLKGGLVNDIDGGVSLFPDHITDRGEYVFVLNPALMDEADLEKCNLKADDNPMIVIGLPK